ncbi:unnamed protein product [Fusarium graminearum]|nr:unnamed protein product [Fusarium graminearum]
MRELWFFPGELAGPRSRIPLPTDFGPDQNDGDPVIKWIHTQGLHISPRLIVSHSAAHGRPYSLRSVFCGPLLHKRQNRMDRGLSNGSYGDAELHRAKNWMGLSKPGRVD